MGLIGLRLMGVILWMAIWWISEVVPIAVTALLTIILFPSCDIMSIQDTGANYGHKYIFLFPVFLTSLYHQDEGDRQYQL